MPSKYKVLPNEGETIPYRYTVWKWCPKEKAYCIIVASFMYRKLAEACVKQFFRSQV